MRMHEWAYGSHPSQFVRLYTPVGQHLPVAVVVHGGYWRQTHGVELAEPLARDIARFGIAAAAVEYRRVGDGGGWPTTLADVARAVDSLAGAGQHAADGRLALERVAAVGHSAGGQLAAWLAHRGSLRSGTAGSVGPGVPHVPVVGVVSQAGVLDLVGASQAGLSRNATDDLMGGPAGSLPQRYHHASPLAHVGDGARIALVHGDADVDVPLEQSERYFRVALEAGDPVTLQVLPGIGHFQLIDPDHAAWQVCRDELLRMI